ncbi:MAG: GntR family transcriptional regulator, partial [Acidobacteriaceae bacterium]
MVIRNGWAKPHAELSGARRNQRALNKMPGRSDEPAYRKIQGAIRRRIDAGQLKPGNLVPSERELARIHSVSLMTARHALTELARDGIVERRHGAGTFVAPPKVQFNKLLGYTEQMASLG